jgi:hypothetical protein
MLVISHESSMLVDVIVFVVYVGWLLEQVNNLHVSSRGYCQPGIPRYQGRECNHWEFLSAPYTQALGWIWMHPHVPKYMGIRGGFPHMPKYLGMRGGLLMYPSSWVYGEASPCTQVLGYMGMHPHMLKCLYKWGGLPTYPSTWVYGEPKQNSRRHNPPHLWDSSTNIWRGLSKLMDFLWRA